MAILSEFAQLNINTAFSDVIGPLFADSIVSQVAKVNPYGNVNNMNGEALKVPVASTLTSSTFTPGSERTYQAATATARTFGTFVQKTVPFKIEWNAFSLLMQGYPSLSNIYIEQAARELVSDVIETDLMAEYANFSATAITASSGLDDAAILSARQSLSDSKVPLRDRVLIVTPERYSDLLNQTLNPLFNRNDGIGQLAEQAVRDGSIGSVRGFQVYESPYVTTTGASPVVTHCIAMQRGALGIQFVDMFAEPMPNVEFMKMNFQGIPLRLTVGTNQKDDTMLLNLDVIYAVGILWNEKALAINVSG